MQPAKWYTFQLKSWYIIQPLTTNNNVISPGLAAFMHFYSHSPNYTAIGGTFGVGAGFQNTSDVNLSIYFGPSIIFGKEQKLTFSTGWSYLKVRRIKDDQFNEGTRYKTAQIDLSQVTESVFKPSLFFSISYNLSNRTELSR